MAKWACNSRLCYLSCARNEAECSLFRVRRHRGPKHWIAAFDLGRQGFLAHSISDALTATDTLAEWLRRRPAKPMGPRVGSNPTGVDFVLPVSLRDRRRY